MGEKALRFLLWVNDISFIIGEIITKSLLMGVPSGSVVKNLPLMQETQVQSLGREDPQRRAWKPTPVFLPGKSRTEEPGRLESRLESQRVRHDLMTKQQQQSINNKTGLINTMRIVFN